MLGREPRAQRARRRGARAEREARRECVGVAEHRGGYAGEVGGHLVEGCGVRVGWGRGWIYCTYAWRDVQCRALHAARGARWSALRPNAANYGMPNLELQLGNVRPPLGTRPCAQRSEHAAVARVVDELRAGGSGSKGQHRDSREATLKRAANGRRRGKLIQRCAQKLGCSAALTCSSIASRARGRPSKQLSEVSKPMSRSAHELT